MAMWREFLGFHRWEVINVQKYNTSVSIEAVNLITGDRSFLKTYKCVDPKEFDMIVAKNYSHFISHFVRDYCDYHQYLQRLRDFVTRIAIPTYLTENDVDDAQGDLEEIVSIQKRLVELVIILKAIAKESEKVGVYERIGLFLAKIDWSYRKMDCC